MDIFEKNRLKTTAYFYGANFSNILLFFNSINESGEFKEEIRNCKWKNELYKEELNRLIDLSKDFEEDNFYRKYREKECLQNFFLILEEAKKMFNIKIWPQLFLVDSLKSVPEGKEWSAMSIDEMDSKELEIPEGIYFMKKYLIYGFFEFTVAHELVHWVISQYSIKYFPYVPIVEEGICDFMATILLYKTKLFPIEVIKNFVLHNKQFTINDTLGETYGDFFRIILIYCQNNGFSSVLELIKSGRERITKFCNESIIKTDLKSNIDIQPLLRELLNVQSYFTLPIQEYYILKATTEIGKLEFQKEDIEVNLPKDVLENALDKLNIKGYLFKENDFILQMNQSFFNNVKFKNE